MISHPHQHDFAGESSQLKSIYAYYVVCVLMIAYMFAFMDRVILSLVIDPVRADLGLTEVQISLLVGFAFALFYTVLGLPCGRWADTRGRRNLIAVGIALWSLATMVCGLVANFWQMFIARMMVGVGEAGLTPAAYSLVPDYFPPDRRGVGMAIFTVGPCVGGGLAMLVGGIIVEWATHTTPALWIGLELAPWQIVFILVGAPGLLVALIVALTVREPRRRLALDESTANYSVREVVDYLKINRLLFTLVFLGFTGFVVNSYAFLSWGPSYYMRFHEFDPSTVGLLFFVAFGCAGTMGMLGGGAVCDRLSRRGIRNAPIRVSIVAALISTPLFVVAWSSPTSEISVVAFIFAVGSSTVYGGLQAVAIQEITPNKMRGQVAALYLTIANIIGLGVAPTLTALMTQHVFGGELGVGKSLMVISVVSLISATFSLSCALKPAKSKQIVD